MRGFETGFRAGYADSYSGKTFRLARWSGSVSIKIEKTTAPGFDQGIAAGYTAGFKNVDSIQMSPV